MAFRALIASRRGRVLALGALGAVAALASLAMPSPARADHQIVSSSPEDGSEVTVQPTAITMTFDNDIEGSTLAPVVCNNDPFNAVGTITVSDDNRTMTIPLTGELPATPSGNCTVSWVLNNADGQQEASGSLRFTVSAAAVPAGQAGTAPVATVSATADDTSANGVQSASSVSTGPIWLGRVMSIVGISVLFGSLVLIVAAWPEGPEYVLAMRFLRYVWILGVVGTFIYVAALTAAVKGESFGSGFNPSGWFDLFDAGWAGRAAVMRIVFVLACGWVVLRPERVIDPTTNMLALGIPALTVVTLGLSRTEGSFAFLGALASIAHVLAMSVWFGGAVLLSRVVLAGPGEEDLVHAVRGFCRISNPAIIVTVVSGLIQVWRLDGGQVFSTGHGWVLLLKTLAVGAMVFIGMTARQVVNARLARASELSVDIADRMRRAFGAEAVIGLVVVALSGWMLNLTPGKLADFDVGDFDVQEVIADPNLGLEMEVLLRPGRVGDNDLTVIVWAPESGLSGLELNFFPPTGSGAQRLSQAIPLTGRGRAHTVDGSGLPFPVAGNWRLQVVGTAPDGSSVDINRPFQIRNADGSLPDAGTGTVPAIPGTTTSEPSVQTTEATG